MKQKLVVTLSYHLQCTLFKRMLEGMEIDIRKPINYSFEINYCNANMT